MSKYTWFWNNHRREGENKWEMFSDEHMTTLDRAWHIGKKRLFLEVSREVWYFHLDPPIAFYKGEDRTRPVSVRFEEKLPDTTDTADSSKVKEYSGTQSIFSVPTEELKVDENCLSSRLEAILQHRNWTQSSLDHQFFDYASQNPAEIEEALKEASAGCSISVKEHHFTAKCQKLQLWTQELVLTNDSKQAYGFEVLNPTSLDESTFFTCMHVQEDEESRSFLPKGEVPPESEVKLEIGVVTKANFNRLIVIQCTNGKSEKLFVAVQLECSGGSLQTWKVSNSDFSTTIPIGKGSSGTVYQASIRGFECAAKVFSSSKNARSSKNAQAEIKSLQEASHPHVISLIGKAKRGGQHYAFMKMGGDSLSKVLECGGMEYHQRLLIAKQIADGMLYLHHKKHTHRDIKPDNIVFMDDRAVIIDLGSEGVAGTPPYMAPEAFLPDTGQFGPKVDIFSFGLLLWELLKAEKPRRDSEWKQLWAGDTPPLSDSGDTPHPLLVRQLYYKCVEIAPQDRPDAKEVLDTLNTVHSDFVKSISCKIPKNC